MNNTVHRLEELGQVENAKVGNRSTEMEVQHRKKKKEEKPPIGV